MTALKANNEREADIRRITLWGAGLNVLLMAVKIFFGIIVRSSALIADGIHSLSDLATDFVVLAGARLSNRPPDTTHPYGHGKFETLSTWIVGIILMGVSTGLIWDAAASIYRREHNFPGAAVLIVAIISVITKEIMFRITRRTAEKRQSPSLYANAWHHRSDALSSVAVLIGGAAGLLGWGYADQAAAAVVGIMIFIVAGKILYEAFVDLTDHAVDRESQKKIQSVLDGEREFCSWHAMRTRRIGGEFFLDLHILCNPGMTVQDSHEISVRIENKIQRTCTKPVHILIHIEPDSEDRHSERR